MRNQKNFIINYFLSKKRFFSLAWETIKTAFFISFIVFVIRYFIFQPFFVIGISMEPNYHQGEYLLVNQLAYRLSPIKRGEVVVFKYKNDTSRNYIKRIIGLPKESVEVKDGKIFIFNQENPNGFQLEENYVPKDIETFGNVFATLGDNEYFVLGDNRYPNASSDSREWGVLPQNLIIGKAWIKLWPLAEIGFADHSPQK